LKESQPESVSFKVGLTGGIASGKTTVSNMFAELGVPVIDTDIVAREVVEPGKPTIEAIRERFGDAVISKSGTLERGEMRKIVFRDDTARADLEAILHPRIGAEVRRQSALLDAPYQIIAVPLLVDSALLQFVDRVLVVDCEEDTQIHRLMQRDSGTIEEAKRILASQSSRDERLAIADDVIRNDRDLAHLRRRVTALHDRYRRLAKH
jgi:dephospho-CoA kinase